jgi:MFS superfamily sulfate permease-like transporter
VVVAVLAAAALVAATRAGVRRVPAPLVVLAVAIPAAAAFDFTTAHDVGLFGHAYAVGPHLLVELPSDFQDALVTPDFSRLPSATSLKYVVMLALIATIESLLSARAVDALDPWRRRPDLNRDLLAAGVGNLVSAGVGGLPMISEVVRSSANVAAGARTRWANAAHGVFLLLFVTLLPAAIHYVPRAALAVLLVHTAARLASPTAFRAARAVGPEQAAVFAATLVMTLATDLLVGVAAGLALNAALCVSLGAPLRALVQPTVDVERRPDGTTIRVRDAAVFATYLALRRAIPAGAGPDVAIDLSATRVVDHTTLERLHGLREELAGNGVRLTLTGLDDHQPLSSHPRAGRVRRPAPRRRAVDA